MLKSSATTGDFVTKTISVDRKMIDFKEKYYAFNFNRSIY